MTTATVAPVLRTLLAGAVDYAGLYPPASLPMPEAVANFAEYRRSPDAWALGRFVVGSARLSEFEPLAAARAPGPGEAGPWPVALVAATPEEAAPIAAFNARWSGRLVIDALEARAASPAGVRGVADAAPAGVAVFVELALDDALDECLDAVRASGASAKLRTGGVIPDAFPRPDDVIRFVRGCHRRGLAFKATAGLHHPVRGSYPLTYATGSARGVMYGYLNLLLAAAVIAGGGDDATARRALLASDVGALRVSDGGLAWEGAELTVAGVDAVRRFLRGFGSCSFREPVDELASLALAAR